MNIRTLFCTAVLSLCALGAHAETRAVIDTNQGQIELSLDERRAPKTVANFVSYAQKGFYNNTIFHRVIPGFMIQGGGLSADMREKATERPISNEAANGLKNDRYTIAMARTALPHSASSQFFINLKDNPFLNYTSADARGYGRGEWRIAVWSCYFLDQGFQFGIVSRHYSRSPLQTIQARNLCKYF